MPLVFKRVLHWKKTQLALPKKDTTGAVQHVKLCSLGTRCSLCGLD
jgi:hypothetical protein